MFKKILSLFLLPVLLTACALNNPNGLTGAMADNSVTGKGERYLLGRGVPQDNAKAFAYFTQGAHEGNVFAENELAYLYAAGQGTTRNYAQALFWYQKAAQHDLASAQYNLGLMYQYGLGTKSDQAMAQTWFRKAAAHGFEPAQAALSAAPQQSLGG